MSRLTRASEPCLHTTRVFPGGFALSAEASDRTLGTLPPAAGLTEVSGFGFGQNAVRSTCAKATAAHATATTAASIAAQATRPIKPRSLTDRPFHDFRSPASVKRARGCTRRFLLR